MKAAEYRLGFYGFGHMAQVIFEAIDRARIVPRSHVSFIRRDRLKMRENEQKFHITSTSLPTLVQQSDLIFLCFRPQQAEAALKELSSIGGFEGKWVVSILSGVSIEAIKKRLPGTQVLRVMPNIASAVNEGMTTLTFDSACSSEFRSFAHLLFGAMGEVAEVDEEFSDIIVGLSGSGPGFVFRLIETMARTGEKHGLPYPKALKIAAQTFAGAARLILKGNAPADLITQITTPNGTTHAGFEMMKNTEIDKHFESVIEASARRSSELAL